MAAKKPRGVTRFARLLNSARASRKLAEALLDKVEAGDIAALKEFGDRFDGKVAQQILGGGDEGDHTLKIIHESR